MNNTTFGLLFLGVLLLLGGLVMPGTTTVTETDCINPDYDVCLDSEKVTVTSERTNEYKAPTLVGGAVLLVVGVFSRT